MALDDHAELITIESGEDKGETVCPQCGQDRLGCKAYSDCKTHDIQKENGICSKCDEAVYGCKVYDCVKRVTGPNIDVERGVVEIDPASKEGTFLGYHDEGTTWKVTVRGLWKPGRGWEWNGPRGNGTSPINGMPAHCAVISIHGFGWSRDFYYTGPLELVGGLYGVRVRMNDKKDFYGDNVNHPKTPMIAEVILT